MAGNADLHATGIKKNEKNVLYGILNDCGTTFERFCTYICKNSSTFAASFKILT